MQSSKNAKELRRQSTAAERTLWAQLRGRRPGGRKFRRQYPMGSHVADFICFEARAIIELDGPSHELNVEYDARRDAWFGAKGFRVLRIPNEEVRTNLEGVVVTICRFCEGL